MSILHLLSKNSYIIVNKTLSQELGMEEAAMIGQLCALQEHFNGQFYRKHEELSEEVGISLHRTKKVMKSLEEKKIITVERKGIPRKNHYLINEKELEIVVNTKKQKKEKTPLTCEGKSHSLESGNPSHYNSKDNSKRDTKVSHAEVDSAGFDFEDNIPEENSLYQWIRMITESARDKSIETSQPFSIPRNDKAKYIKQIDKYLSELQNGTFLKLHKFDSNYLDHLNKNQISTLQGLTREVLLQTVEKVVSSYLKARNNPEDYNFIGRDRKIDLGTFFYEFNENNGVLGVSHFLMFYCNPPVKKNQMSGPERMLERIYEKDLSKMYGNVYNNYRDFSDEEMLRMVKSILSLCRWWKRNNERLLRAYKGSFKLRFPKGMETFIEYYLGKFITDHRYEHPISLFPEKKHWKGFCDWMFEQTSIDLEIENKKEKKKSESSISVEEIKRRMEAD